MNTKRIIIVAFVALSVALSGAIVNAQTVTVLTSGLKRPSKIIRTEQGNLLVAEAGLGMRDGRISIIDAQTGMRRTLLDGLPSATGRAGLAQGPSGLVLRERTLYITIGEGNPTVACVAPCFQIPNPAGASSPIFSSILALNFSAQTEMTTNGFMLALSDDFLLRGGHRLTLTNGGGDMATLRLVADFHDTAPAPLPGAPENVAASNPFGIDIIDTNLYIPDGGMNNVWKVDTGNGGQQSLVTFPNFFLPSGEQIEPVPAGIRVYQNHLLVALYTGSDNPLRAGLAEIRLVSPLTGNNFPFIGGLTSAIDVLPIQTKGNPDYLYVLQFGVIATPNLPARLLRFDAPGTPPVSNSVIGGLVSSMTRNPLTGDLFMTRTFAGTIIRVQIP